jgi:hypothetical protein
MKNKNEKYLNKISYINIMNLNYFYQTVKSFFLSIEMYLYSKMQEYQSAIPIYRLYIQKKNE